MATTDLSGLGATGGYDSSSYESSTTGGALGDDLAYAGAALDGVGASSYELSTYSSPVDNIGGADSVETGLGGDLSSSPTTAVQQYVTDAQGLFQDSNPQIVRRPAPGGDVTYTQNIRVRFLQPPPVPPPDPLIIKEVRPPEPPPPSPLRVRQQAPPLPQLPPLVLRERSPVSPASVASQTVIRQLAAIPVSPQSVIIERLPAAPAKPHDIIIERGVPYGAQAKRKTIVQHAAAAAAQQYTSPRNIIIQYEIPQVRIVRQFQRLGVTQENPAAYLQRYGASLLDAQTLLQQARAAGVIEDISLPVVDASLQFVSSSPTFEDVTVFEAEAVDLDGTSSYESSTGLTLGGIADVNHDGVLSQDEFQSAGY